MLVRKRAHQGGLRFRRHRRQLRQSLYAAGLAYVLLHHVFGEVNGKKGAWGHAIGGMGAITQAMAKAAAERGVDIRSSPVREVLVEPAARSAWSPKAARPSAPAASCPI
jgi:phytoene dehydrogenase-like protein